ncbi:hypothetical protein FTW19_02850 [Terriglobus albidus]|uniref:TonB-dependent transporter Oar-like beta-barrel domain-containing protein n=1 Tax=Terriglobus albidus TaxID=1592106 RepID=A0A5B9E8Y0_9BACT|nr:TonB-dependent receptor [Terriglobus albidus]QEE27040.1 hypothetical protein FTW19_02850 [Terriglobus albidus]
MNKLFAVVVFLFGLVLCTVPLTAQTSAGLGTITGTVTDQSKAAVSGATVILSNALTGETRTATTNSQGGYQFLNLRVISGYSIKVESKGFSTREVKDIKTSVGSATNADVTLAVGSESVVISVEGGSSEQVQTETSSLSELVDSSVWKSSPLESRTQNEFVQLVAGASPDTAATGRGFAVNGARTGTGNFLVEGFDNNDQGQGGAGFTFGRGGAVTSISPDAIQEYRVITHVPPAEYGRAGGFSTDTVLKSGANQWHGSLFEYNRIQTLAANSWFSNNSGLRDHRVRNQFGGSIGGPIRRDKTFFFATLEIHRYREGVPTVVTATTQQFLDFVNNGSYQKFMEGTAFQNPSAGQEGICPIYLNRTCQGAFARQSTLGPVFKALYAKYPSSFPLATSSLDNGAQGLLSGGALSFPVPVYGLTGVIQTTVLNQNRGTIKIDHKLTEKDQLAFSYIPDLYTSSFNNGGGDSTPGPPYNNVGGSQVFGASWTRTWTPTLITQGKASYLRHVSNFEVPGTTGVPSVYTADSLLTGFGASTGLPQYFTDNQFAYEGSLTKTLGSHTAKAGFRFVRTRNGSSFYNDINGNLAFWSVEGLVTDGTADEDQLKTAATAADAATYGSLYSAGASLDPTTNSAPDPYRGYRAKEFAAYVQDDWKATSRLTLNYGVRWEYFGPPHNFRAGFDSNVYFGNFGTPTATGNPNLPNTPLLAATQGAFFAQKDSNIWNKDMNNFAPRLGFSYDTMGNGRLVLRGGFGIGYDRLYNNVYENIRFNYPHFVDNTYGFGAGSAGISPTLRSQLVQVPFTGNSALAVAGAKPVPRHIDQRLVTAYYEQAHFGVQSGFSGYVFEATYVGTFGRKLVGLMNINTFEGRTACMASSSTAQKALCAAQGYTTYSSARPTPLFNNDNFRTNAFGSNYNGGQVSVRKSFAKGVQMLANYTYSKAMDNTSDVFTVKSAGTGIVSPYNPRYEYGAADFDTRHNLVVTSNIESQWKKKNLLLGGWALSPIFSWRSGSPIYIKNGASTYDPNKDGTTGVDRAVYLKTGDPRSSINHNVSPASGYITKGTWGAYSCPTVWCDPPVQRNSIYGPRFINLDLGAIKRFAITERQTVTFQTSFFNIFNHPNFKNPIGDTNNANFGKSTDVNKDARITQMSLRYDF